ncbi:MAG TPA: response regulator [Actinomycetota bacterium]|nr:response regulator [Actinomycetota bacterium]
MYLSGSGGRFEARGYTEETVNSGARHKILITDDDPVIIELLQVNLEFEGYDVISAADGVEAVERAARDQPDLVILDIMMPRMDGWTARAELLKDPRTANIPVIFLSARAQQADLRKGYESGVAAYVTKPFEPVELLDLIAQILSGSYVRPESPPGF